VSSTILNVFNFLLGRLLSLRYSIKVKGLENIDPKRLHSKSGTIVLPSHPSYLDAPLVILSLWKKLRPRPLALETYYYMPLFHKMMKLLRVLPVPNFYTSGNSIKKKRWLKVFSEMEEQLKQGEDFLIYPSGKVKLTSVESLGGTSTVYDILQKVPDANVILVRIEGMWGSRLSKALRDTAPDFKAEFFFAIKALFKNLFFLVPKREITITYEVAGEYFPRKGNKLDINRYLERWYNNCLEEEKIVGEPLSLISYNYFNEELPAVYEPKEEKSVDLSQVPQKTKDEVLTFLAKLSGKKELNINPEQNLANDLGLDSLDAAEIITFLQDKYQVKRIYPQQLTTVLVVMGLAANLIQEESDPDQTDDVGAIPLKLWNQLGTRKLVRMPPGRTIPEVFLNSCSRMKGAACFADAISGVITYSDMKTRVILLARHFRSLEGNNIGILLPSSGAAYICLLAVTLAGKVPVMINWTTGKKHIEHVVDSSGVKHIISSWKFIDRLDGVDLDCVEEKLLLLEDIRSQLTFLDKVKAKVDSFKATKSLLRDFEIEDLPSRNPSVILYTSGTESLPKGVPLTHHNVLSNLRSAVSVIHLTPDDGLLAYLPPFHSFGFSITGLLPLLAGVRAAYSPDPTNSSVLVSMIDKFKPSIVCGAPTFLKGILKNGTNEQFESVRLFVTGAEKASQEVAKRVKEMEWAELVEGYGITECAPIISFNEPGFPKKGTGKPISGVEILIVHPETLAPMERTKEGLILTRGPNVFKGYTDGEIQSPFLEVMGKSWYKTGDLGSLDEEGNIYISGRLKRFVKVAGEMISLASLEDAIYEGAEKNDWKLSEEGPSLAVLAKEETDQKSQFFLFSRFDLSLDEANQALREGGISNLAKFSKVTTLDEIPVMGTGKVNYRHLEKHLQEDDSINLT
jgi:acyl-CoA synthetase (AMP-forming)/AMP-acid ligase II/acyl carrier protein/1-acyl-sn-glycerol-3-phosphate acyltransferase